MPVFYTQSNQPRNFGYMAQNNKPIMELQGKMRRIDTTKAVAGTWEGLVNQPTTCQARSNSASSQFNFNASSKRTVCPEQNVEKTQANSKRMMNRNQSVNAGNWDTLFAKTGNCEKLWQYKRTVQGKGISLETEQPVTTKRIIKAEPLKTKYDYSSQITSLPLGKCHREAEEKPIPMKCASSARTKTLNEWHSSIQNLPGSLKDRQDGADSKRELRQVFNNNRILVERNIITSDSQALLKDDSSKRTTPRYNPKNLLSNSHLDQENRLHVQTGPTKAVNGPFYQNKISKQEYFGLPDFSSKGRSARNLDLFKSTFDLN